MTTGHGSTIPNPTSLNNSAYWASALTKAESAAISAIRSKVRSEQAAFGGLNFLAELGQTIKGLRNPGKALVESIGSLLQNVALHNKAELLMAGNTKTAKGRRRKRDISKNRSRSKQAALDDRSRLLTGKTFAQTWLEFSFGWSPLVSDAKAIAEGLTQYFWKDTMRRAYGSSGEHQQAIKPTFSPSIGASAGIISSLSTNVVATVRIKYAVGIKRELTGPKGQIGILLQRESGSLADIAPAIWEIVPWSWLLDYVANIGDIINAATQSMTGVVWISKTTIITVVKTEVWKPEKRAGYNLQTVGGSTVQTKFEKITRESVLPSQLGVPSLTFCLPGSGQLFNVAALLRTFLRR
nr:MAG: hypothetical protein 1 [Leviviridae sp.]